jgi:hypothetical protein
MPASGYTYLCMFDELKEGLPRQFEAEGVPSRIADRSRPTAQVKLSPALVARRTTAPPPA